MTTETQNYAERIESTGRYNPNYAFEQRLGKLAMRMQDESILENALKEQFLTRYGGRK